MDQLISQRVMEGILHILKTGPNLLQYKNEIGFLRHVRGNAVLVLVHSTGDNSPRFTSSHGDTAPGGSEVTRLAGSQIIGSVFRSYRLHR